MICFESAGALLRALNRVKSGKPPAALVANHYVLLEQRQGQAAVTVLEAGQYWGTAYVPTLPASVADSRYLLHPEELEEVLRAIDGAAAITLRPASGGAVIATDLGYRVVSTYSDLSHYGPLRRANRLWAELPGSTWQELTRRISRFSGSRDSDLLQFSAWALRLEGTQLLWLAPTPTVASQTYLYEWRELEKPAEAAVVCGRLRYLKQLRELAGQGTVQLFHEHNLLTVSGELGEVTLQTLEPDLALQNFLSLPQRDCSRVGHLRLSRRPLLEAVKLQRPGPRQRLPYLLLQLDGAELSIRAYGNTQEESRLAPLDGENWPDLYVNAAGLIVALESSSAAEVELNLKRFPRADGSYAHFLQLDYSQEQQVVLPVLFPTELEGM